MGVQIQSKIELGYKNTELVTASQAVLTGEKGGELGWMETCEYIKIWSNPISAISIREIPRGYSSSP